MILTREPNSEIIAQFAVPVRGTWKNIAAHTIPLDALHDSLNVFIREGKLRNRPGLVRHDDQIFLNPVIGGVMLVTPQEKMVIAVTLAGVYELSEISNAWVLRTVSSTSEQASIAADDNSVVDITTIETSSTYRAIIASEGYKLKEWTSSPRLLRTLTGTNIPTAKSVCIAANRVIALIPPHTVVWSKSFDPTDFDTLSVVRKAQTGDLGICVRTLSSLSFVLYKERSIYIARAQAGVDESTAFSFAEPLIVEGPAGIYAVVNIGGAHIYMTRNGRIALFTGSNYPTWIADGLWLFLQHDINQSFSKNIRGVYDYRLHTVTFYYPKIGEEGILRGMVIINMPLEGIDLETPTKPAIFLGVCEKSITHCCEQRWSNEVDHSLLFSSPLAANERNTALLLDENADTDDGVPFDCTIQTGLQSMPDARHSQVTVETFLERGDYYGAVTLDGVVSDSLETPGGTVLESASQNIDLSQNTVRDYRGFNKLVRFFGLKYTWKSTDKVRYAGAVLYSSGQRK